MQGDNKLISAEELMPYLAGLQIVDAELADARDWLLTWDYLFDVDSPQAALYAEFFARLMDNLFNDELLREQVENSTMPSELQWEIKSYGADQEMRAAFLLMQQPNNAWWDDVTTQDVVETRDDILIRSFQEAYANTVSDFGKDREEWKWGDLHTATFVSMPLGESGVGFIESKVNRGPVSVSGSTDTINGTQWSVQLLRNAAKSLDFAAYWIPSPRIIFDLSDLTRSVTMNTTGQSGHPYSDNYSDMIEPWRNIEYHPMLWTREQVEASAVERLILNPMQ
jgi:penicillin amidase